MEAADCKSLISPVGKGTQMSGDHGIGAKAYGPFQPFRFGAAPPVHPEASSAEIDRPDGVACSSQVVLNKIEPPEAVLSRNLLSSNGWRSAIPDEPEPVRPKVPLIIKPCSAACRAERLAWARSGPDRAVVRPPGSPEGGGPEADPGEEVALGESNKLRWRDIADIPFVDLARRQQPLGDQVAQPLGCKRIVLVVVSGHCASRRMSRAASSSWSANMVRPSRRICRAPSASSPAMAFPASRSAFVAGGSGSTSGGAPSTNCR